MKPARQPIDGVLLLNKPVGITSNAALQKAKWLLNALKAGHTGTLDPFADGLLPLCFGEATKFSAYLLDADKHYRAVLQLGVTSATGDPEGEILATREVRTSRAEIEAVLPRFTGEIEQIPPMHSALKHQGRPLYEYARAGIEIDRPPRKVTIRSLEMIECAPPRVVLDVQCSAGTYIRTLAQVFFSFEKKSSLKPGREALIKRELLLFIREPSQWTHFLVMTFLITIFILSLSNIDVMILNAYNTYLKTLIYLIIYLFNVFLIASMSLRFIFPLVSLEGETIWKIRSAPLNHKKLMLTRLFIYFSVIFVIGQLLNFVSNYQFSIVLTAISQLNTAFVTITLVSLNFGLGAVYSNYKERNPIRIGRTALHRLRGPHPAREYPGHLPDVPGRYGALQSDGHPGPQRGPAQLEPRGGASRVPAPSPHPIHPSGAALGDGIRCGRVWQPRRRERDVRHLRPGEPPLFLVEDRHRLGQDGGSHRRERTAHAERHGGPLDRGPRESDEPVPGHEHVDHQRAEPDLVLRRRGDRVLVQRPEEGPAGDPRDPPGRNGRPRDPLVQQLADVTLEPCLLCLGAIAHARVGRLVYGADDPKRGALAVAATHDVASLLHHRFSVTAGVLAEAGGSLLRAFFRERRLSGLGRGTLID